MYLEKPDKGRATIREEGGAYHITISTKKSPVRIFMALFMCAWLGGWATGEVMVIGLLTGQLIKVNPEGLPLPILAFTLFWLIGWTIGRIAIIVTILWFVFGKEAITFSPEALAIGKKIFSIGRTKRYALSDVKNLRVDRPGNYGFGNLFNFARPGRGALLFDYGMKTVRFANEIDESEAQYLLRQIIERYASIT